MTPAREPSSFCDPDHPSPIGGPRVSIVIVSYNCKEHLDRCLASLAAHAGVEHEVVVVDNASTDGTVEILTPRWPSVRWIANRENIGFARANNQAFAIARAPYWLALNPDTEMRAGALPAMLAYLESEPRVAVVGPEVERPGGGLERSAGFVPTLAREAVETFLLFRLGARGAVLRGRVSGPTRVDWVSGCALLVRAAAACEVGVFDERFFMYFEDLDWCYRFGRAGWGVVYLPGPRVLHHRGASVLASSDALTDGGMGLEQFVRKHGLRYPIPLLRALLALKLATRALWLWWRGVRGQSRAFLEARMFARTIPHALGLRRVERRGAESGAKRGGNAQRGVGGRRYGFVKPRLTRLFTIVDAVGGLVVRPRRPPKGRRIPDRILLVNLAHFGDVLLTTPAVAAIRAAHPHAHIAMLVGPWSESVVARNPRLDEVLVHRASWWDRGRGSPYLSSSDFRALIAMLRRGRFDAVVNFKSFFQENLAAAVAGIPDRVGYGLYGGGFLQTMCVPFPWEAHTVDQHLELAAALGAPAVGPVPEIFPSEEDVRVVEEWLTGVPHPLVAMHLGAGAPARIWPAESFAKLAQLAESRLLAHVVLVGATGEEPLVERFRRHAPTLARDAVGRFTVPQLAVLLRRCRAFVGNDSGPAHVAAAVGIPTVTVFSGANRLDEWRPRGPAVAAVQEVPECSPCGLAVCKRDDHACMTRITPERVFKLLEGLIEGRCASAS